MARPVIGIIGNSYLINDEYPAHAAGSMNCQAIAEVSGAVPMIVPSCPSLIEVEDLLASCDGFLFTGGRPNVHPEEYGEAETEAHGAFDRSRDRIALPLIRMHDVAEETDENLGAVAEYCQHYRRPRTCAVSGRAIRINNEARHWHSNRRITTSDVKGSANERKSALLQSVEGKLGKRMQIQDLRIVMHRRQVPRQD